MSTPTEPASGLAGIAGAGQAITQAAAGTSWLADLDFWVDGVSPWKADTQGPPPGEGFSLNRDQAVTMLALAENVLKDLQRWQNAANSLEKLTPPAGDPVSTGYNQQLTWNNGPGAFKYGAGHVARETAYLEELIARLREALGIVNDREEETSKGIPGAAEGEGYA